jgi:hypothetical protein
MNAAELAIDGLAAQEAESLAACIARRQEPASYQDIIAKIRGHVERLPTDRKLYWTGHCRVLGVELFPPPEPKKVPEKKVKSE